MIRRIKTAWAYRKMRLAYVQGARELMSEMGNDWSVLSDAMVADCLMAMGLGYFRALFAGQKQVQVTIARDEAMRLNESAHLN
jgi:hypothetical protein